MIFVALPSGAQYPEKLKVNDWTLGGLNQENRNAGKNQFGTQEARKEMDQEPSEPADDVVRVDLIPGDESKAARPAKAD